MKKCQYCGKSMADDLLVCPHCGQPVSGALKNSFNNASSVKVPDEAQEGEATVIPNVSSQVKTNSTDSGSFGWAVLGFFIPLVGLILFLVWRRDRPLSANSSGIGALVSVVTNMVFWISIFITLALVR